MKWHQVITLPIEIFLSLVVVLLDRLQGWRNR